MPSVKLSLVWNTLNTVGRLGLSFIATIVLARLLRPEDFGLWGLIAVFVSISELLADSGMGGYLIKKQNLKSIDYSTLFVYNLVVSVLLYIVIFIAAPFIADFYHNDKIISAIRVASFAILFQALGITANSKLLKELQFKELAIISIGSGLISLMVATILAYKHFGYWALIYQNVSATFLGSLGAYIYSRHFPGIKFNFQIFKEQFSFGINLMGANLLNSLSTNIGNNIIGKFFNLSLTGQYVQASKLQGISTSMISSVVDKTFFPHFARINHDINQIHQKGKELTRRMFAYCFPMFLVVIFFAKFIVNILLGSQWIECTPMLQVLMIASFPALGKAMNRNLLKSTGNTKSIFFIELYSTIVLFVTLSVAIFAKSFWLIVISFVVTQFVAYILSVIYLHKKLSFRLWDLFVDFGVFIPLIIIPLILALLWGFDFKIFALSFFPILAIYIGAGLKEYKLPLKNK